MRSRTLAATIRNGVALLGVCLGLMSVDAYAALTFTYQGRFLTPDGTAPLTDIANITFSIYNPSGSCLLEQEVFSNVDLAQLSGVVALSVGTGTRTGTDPALTMEAVLSNRPGVLRASGADCVGGYSPSAADGRIMQVHVDIPSRLISTDLTPSLKLDTVPLAYEAQKLQGYQAADFILAQSPVTQTNLNTLTNGSNADSLHRHDAYVKVGAANPGFSILGGQTLGLGQIDSTSEASLTGLTAGAVWYNSTTQVLKYYDGTSIVAIGASGVSGGGGGSATNFTGALTGDVRGTQSATVVASVSGVSAANIASGVNTANAAASINTPSTLVKRDSSGNFTAGNITATNFIGAFSGSFTGAISGNSAGFTGALGGDVTGTQSATAVGTVGGVSAANVASGANAANAATATGSTGTIVKRDSSGNFTAATIFANLSGNAATASTATTAGSATSFTGALTGDVTGTQGSTVVSQVGGLNAASVASGATSANAATSVSGAGTIVQRNASGNFTANIIYGTLNGAASFATQAANATNASAVSGAVNASQIVFGVSAATGRILSSLDSSGNAGWNQFSTLDALGNMSVSTVSANSGYFGAAVGVKTASPAYPLDVANGASAIAARLSGSNVDGPVIRFENTSAQTYHVGSTATGSGAGNGFSIYDVTATAPRLLIDPNGNTGIGTSTPTANLEVARDLRSGGGYISGESNYTFASAGSQFFNLVDLSGEGELTLSAENNATTGNIRISYNISTWMGGDTDAVKIPLTVFSGLGIHGSLIKTLYVVHSGASPQANPAQLWVETYGNAGSFLKYSYRTKGQVVHSYNSGRSLSSTAQATLPSGVASNIVATYDVSSIRGWAFLADGKTSMQIQNGNVGIGTAAPSSALHVVGVITASSGFSGPIAGSIGNFSSGLTVTGSVLTASSGASISGGINANSGGLTNAGVISGVTSISGAGNVTLSSGGASNITLTPSGNVGIGVASPQAQLQLANAVTGDPTIMNMIQLWSNGGSDVFGFGISNSQMNYRADNHVFFTPGTAPVEAMRIDVNRKVGIGTATPGALLHLASTGASAGQIVDSARGDGIGAFLWGRSSRGTVSAPSGSLATDEAMQMTAFLHNGTGFNAIGQIDLIGDGDQTTGSSPGAIRLLTTASGVTGSSERMRVDSNGNVGVGTASPSQQLELTKNALLPAGNSNVNGNLFFGGDTSTGANGLRMFSLDALGGGFIDVKASTGVNGIIFRTDTAVGGTERMRITAGGNVGIGTTAPSGALHVIGVVTASSGFSGTFTGTTGTYSGLLTASSGLTVTAGTLTASSGASISGGLSLSGGQTMNNGDWISIKNSTGTPQQILNLDSGNSLRLRSGGGPIYINPDQNSITTLNFNNNQPVQVGNGTVATNFTVVNGSVGIGTTSPTYSLDVVGSGRFGMSTSSAYPLGTSYNDLLLGSGSTGSGSNTYVLLGHSAPTGGISYIQAFLSGAASNTFAINPIGGSVGIGTTSPLGILNVVGSSGVGQGIQFDNQEIKLRGDGDAHYSIFANRIPGALTIDDTSGSSSMGAGAVVGNLLTLVKKNASTGYVGIGTTAPGNPLTLYTAGGGSPIGAMSIDVGTFSNGANATASYFFRVRDVGASVTPFTILGSGNVGIGTASPSNMLHLDTIGNYGIQISNNAAGKYWNLNIDNSNDSNLKISSDSVDPVMYFGRNGYVGIGTTAPSSALHVVGVVTASSGFSGTFSGTTGSYSGLLTASSGLTVSSGLLTVSSGGASITGLVTAFSGVNLNNQGIAAAGPISGVTSITGAGAVSLAAGGAGALSLSTAGTGSFTVATSGSTRMTVDSNGNVGVGTTAPADNLHVYGSVGTGEVGIINQNASAASGAFAIYRQSSDTGRFVIFTNSSTRGVDGGSGNTTLRTDVGNLLLGAGGGQNITLTAGGNVGIGTTGPVSKLNVFNSTTFNPISNALGAITLSGSYGGGLIFSDTNFAGIWATDSGQSLNFGSNATSSGFGTGSGYGQMILKNGNLGIGTAAPSSPLTVYGGTGTTNLLSLDNNNTPGQSAFMSYRYNGALKWAVGTGVAAVGNTFSIYNYNTSSNSLLIDATGNVGIGTTTPSGALDVNGTIRAGAVAAATVETACTQLGALGYNSSTGEPIYCGKGVNTSNSTVQIWLPLINHSYDYYYLGPNGNMLANLNKTNLATAYANNVSPTTGFGSFYNTLQAYGTDSQWYTQNSGNSNCVYEQLANLISYHLAQSPVGRSINIIAHVSSGSFNGAYISVTKTAYNQFQMSSSVSGGPFTGTIVSSNTAIPNGCGLVAWP